MRHAPETLDPTARRSAGHRLLTILAGVALALLAMEAVVRQVYDVRYVRVPGFGWVQRDVLWRMEGNGRSHWTLYDMRRRRLPDPARPSVVVLGDSYTEAFMVDDDEVFTSRLESSLRAAGDATQVLNLGFSGTSCADYAALAEFYRRQFHPRWTIIEIGGGDLTSDSWGTGKCHFVRSPVDHTLGVEGCRPHFEEVRSNPRKQAARAIPAMLLRYGFVRFGEFMTGAAAEPPLFRAGSAGDARAAAQAKDDPSTYPIEEELALVSARYDGRVTFLYLPRLDWEHPEAAESSTETRFEAWCAGGGASCVNLRRSFPGFVADGRSPFGFPNTFFNVGHMNAAGHAAAGVLLFSELTRLKHLGLL